MLTIQPTPPLSDGDALALLLSAEGFVFAAVALAVSLAVPNPKRQQKYKAVTPERVMGAAVALLTLLGAGATAAWIMLVRDDAFIGSLGFLVAAALIVGTVGMPLIAWLVVLSSVPSTKKKSST